MKIFTSFFALTLSSFWFAHTGLAAPTLVRNGIAAATIYSSVVPVAPESAPKDTRGNPLPEPPLATAVRELNYHVQKMSGAALPVVQATDSAHITTTGIVLGQPAVALGATPQKTSESKEAFRLLSKGDLLLIGGESDEAVLLGVYELLERLGCDWVMPGEIGEIIPRQSTVTVPNLDETQAPGFSMRELWYHGYPDYKAGERERHAQWMRRQKSGSYESVAAQTYGHYWTYFVQKHKAEFDKDPTMYALVRDSSGTLVRRGPQIESTHPRVLELMVQDIRDTYAKNKWPKDRPAGFGIGPADGLGYSLSAESLAAGAGRIDPIVGEVDRTDELVLLANRIFEKLGDEYPNLYLGYYSYSVHSDYPQRYQPHPRLVQIFAPINFSRYHSVLDENSKTQAYYKSVVEQWGELARKQGNPLIYRGYNWNLAENLFPYTKVRIWGEELPWYHRMGFQGLNVEATKQWGVLGPSDYVFMKLAWDPSQDWRQLLTQYCRNAFGAGAAPMERYFLRLVETQRSAGQEAGSYHAQQMIFNEAFVKSSQRDMAEALRLAQTPQQKTRVRHFTTSVDALDHWLKYFRAAERFDFVAARKHFNAIMPLWQRAYDENSDVVSNQVPQYLGRLVGTFVEKAEEYSSGKNRMLQPLPDALKTMFDPHEVGHRMRYQSPAINDANFVKTKTYSMPWDAQGLTGLRSGAVWYRHHFKLPKNLQGQPIGLFIGGAEDEARVWINGQQVGTSGQAFSQPFVFDLTDGIRYDGDNVVAIQVVRNSAANELGLGGIIRQSFIFTGPRLAEKAPKPLQLRRVLPGGELGEVEQ